MHGYNNLSDEELIILLRNNDQKAFSTLYDRFQGLLYTYACKIVKDEDIAADLVQDIFFNLWDKRQTINFTTSISSYLYSSIRYKFFDLVDSQKIRSDYAKSFQLFIDHHHYATDDYITEKEFAAVIEEEIANLPARMRKIFVLSRRLYLTDTEIAQQLNISERTVKNQISLALRILRLRLGLCYLLFFLFQR